MIEVEEINLGAPSPHRQRYGWLAGAFLRPARTMRAVAGEEKAAWALPLLLLTALTIISILVAGPLRIQAAQNSVSEPPPNFQYMSPEQQEQYMQAQASMNGPVTAVVFPAIAAVIGVWLGWFLLGSILHLVLTLLGGRGASTSAYNLAAWASLPFAIRLIVQISAMLVTRQLINNPGLSGFVDATAAGALLYARALLRNVDIYLVWQVVLLWLGAAATSGLTRGKAFGGVLAAVLLILALAALPGFLAAQLGGLDVSRPFIFF
jgi:hypothetical protein